MPKRKWTIPAERKPVRTKRGGMLMTKSGPVTTKMTESEIHKSDLAESAQDQKDSDKLLSQEKYLKMIQEANKLREHTPKMDKLKEQRKFNQRKT